MSKIIKIRKGLNIRLKGEAERRIAGLPPAAVYGVAPSDFANFVPKLLVQEGERVEAGQALFFDKKNPDILVVTPVSGVVKAVNRGDRRVIECIEVEADKEQRFKHFDIPATLNKETATGLLLSSGLWPSIIQRPFGVIANPADTPRAIFVSGFDTAPLAPDMSFALSDNKSELARGLAVLGKFTNGKVYLGLKAGDSAAFGEVEGVEKHLFDGPHPAGNVGVQIANIAPVNKGEIVWTVDIQNVALIGRFFMTGRVDMTKTYAVTGSDAAEPRYVKALVGTPVGVLTNTKGGNSRYISGNVLTGTDVGKDGYIGFYSNQLTVIPEGDKYEMLGWAMPRLGKFSVSRTYFSWLQPGKKYDVDTNVNGGHRPFIVTGLFERYVPMDIYPMQLLKAIIAQDIDKMEALGIYEVLPEDFALCEFVDPSKNEIQQIVRDGINLIMKEMS